MPNHVPAAAPLPSDPVPTALDYNRRDKLLTVSFEDGRSFAIPAELLRVESPSAEVQGHGPGQKVTVAGRRHVSIMDIEPVGHYAVRLVFDDLHDTGLYTWQTLYRLGRDQDQIWRDYLAALDAQGLSREP